MLASATSPASVAPRLRVIDLACRRGPRLLFEHLQFDLAAGQRAWVRGRNGRGKTSLLRLAAGLASPERGRVERDDSPAGIDGALQRFGLAAQRHLPVHALSHGQRRRVAPARQALHRVHLGWLRADGARRRATGDTARGKHKRPRARCSRSRARTRCR